MRDVAYAERISRVPIKIHHFFVMSLKKSMSRIYQHVLPKFRFVGHLLLLSLWGEG